MPAPRTTVYTQTNVLTQIAGFDPERKAVIISTIPNQGGQVSWSTERITSTTQGHAVLDTVASGDAIHYHANLNRCQHGDLVTYPLFVLADSTRTVVVTECW